MLIVFIRAVILYILIIFAVRLMGKRQIGELQPAELVVTILVSNIATLALEDMNTPLIISAVPILALVSLDVLMSWVTLKSRFFRKLVSGSPKIIVSGGEIDQKLMKELRFSVDDLMEGIRQNGIFDITEVQLAVVETTGKISVYQKHGDRNATKDDLKIKGKDENPPSVIINSGVIDKKALKESGHDTKWLFRLLAEKKITAGEIFMLTADGNKYNIIEKKGKNKK